MWRLPRTWSHLEWVACKNQTIADYRQTIASIHQFRELSSGACAVCVRVAGKKWTSSLASPLFATAIAMVGADNRDGAVTEMICGDVRGFKNLLIP
jgi:hypothetical protein